MAGARHSSKQSRKRRQSVRRQPSEVLRGLATLAYALQETGVGLNRFGRLYVDREPGCADPSGLEKQWATGETVPTPASIKRLASRLPGIKLLAVHSHPLFDVLLDQPQSKSRERAICQKLFSAPEDSNEPSPWPTLAHRYPGGIFGRKFWEMGQLETLDQFTVILLLMRYFERKNEPGKHAQFCRYVYDCFPYAASLTFLLPHRRLLAHCVDRVHRLSPMSYQFYKIDWQLQFERTCAISQLRASGAGQDEIRAYHEPDALSAWSRRSFALYVAHEPDEVSPKSLIEERWWSGMPSGARFSARPE